VVYNNVFQRKTVSGFMATEKASIFMMESNNRKIHIPWWL